MTESFGDQRLFSPTNTPDWSNDVEMAAASIANLIETIARLRGELLAAETALNKLLGDSLNSKSQVLVMTVSVALEPGFPADSQQQVAFSQSPNLHGTTHAEVSEACLASPLEDCNPYDDPAYEEEDFPWTQYSQQLSEHSDCGSAAMLDIDAENIDIGDIEEDHSDELAALGECDLQEYPHQQSKKRKHDHQMQASQSPLHRGNIRRVLCKQT